MTLLKSKSSQLLPDEELSLVDHLAELRTRIIICALVIAACSAFSYLFIDKIFVLISKPVGSLVFFSPAEAFLATIKLSMLCGLFLALPVVIYHIWQFVSPALSGKERISLYLTIFASLVLFYGGMFFATFILPISLKFLLGFAKGNLQPMLSVSSYISFISGFLLAFGVVFQFPVVIVFLTKIGLTTPAFLRKQRKYAILIMFIVAALVTPSPDVFSQFLLAIPMLVLYEISIFISQLIRADREP